ncbi:MAG: acyl-CoA synthetase [Caulobacterales bacterium]|nr:acyl-CoA synthetase [Caulobacterales bacterium]
MRIAGLADIEAFEAVPAEQRWRGAHTYDVIARTAARFPDRPALKFQFTSDVDEQPLVIDYRSFLGSINQTANALFEAGVRVGGTTSVILPNLPHTHYALWGAQTLGIVGPINPLLEPAALRDIMIESETEALVVLGPTPGAQMWEKALSIADDVPSLKVVFRVNMGGAEVAVAAATPGGRPIIDFDQTLGRQRSDGLDFERTIRSEDVAAYFHTGGTTGTPKLAQHSHANEVHLVSMMVDMFSWDENTIAFGGLPLFHVNAYFNAGLNLFACGGHAVYLTPDGFRTRGIIDNFWKLVEKYRPTYLATVPTVVSALLDVPIDGADLSSMEYFVCGAAPIAPQVFRAFQERTQINLIEAYGLTEGTLFSAGNPLHGEKRVGSIGVRVPYQPMKCVILDDDNRYVRDCKVNEPGVIVFKGPNVFLGYKQQEKNKDAFLDDGWLITGDLAREDEDGYFWMTGRSKDLIIRGGHNIDPKGIEDALSGHPAVALTAAVGQPDAYAGELPCAYVTLSEEAGGAPPTADELKAYAKKHIPERAAAPVHVEILADMPMTAVGKIFKPTLRAMAIERVLGEAAHAVAPSAVVSVRNDERRGVLACISDAAPNLSEEDRARARADLKDALDQFTVAYEFVD